MTCDLSTGRYLKPTWAQEKNTNTLKPWLRWDHQSSPAFCLQKGTTSRESFAATKYSNFFKRGTALCFGCSLFMFEPQSLGQRYRFSSVFNGGQDINSETQHNIFVLLGRIKSGAGDWYKKYHLLYIGWLSSAAPSTFSSTDQREIGTSTGCCSLISFGLCPWTRSIYPTYTQHLLELCRPQLSYRNSCKTWLHPMKSPVIHIKYPNVLLLKSSPAMPPWSFQGRPWVNFCAAIGACLGRSLSALPRPGFDHRYTICCTIWGFPKMGGTQKWMVYKGKYY